MTPRIKVKPKKRVKEPAWVVVDVRKKQPRLCYAFAAGTINHGKGIAAIYYKKPKIPQEWMHFKIVLPCTITYEI